VFNVKFVSLTVRLRCSKNFNVSDFYCCCNVYIIRRGTFACRQWRQLQVLLHFPANIQRPAVQCPFYTLRRQNMKKSVNSGHTPAHDPVPLAYGKVPLSRWCLNLGCTIKQSRLCMVMKPSVHYSFRHFSTTLTLETLVCMYTIVFNF